MAESAEFDRGHMAGVTAERMDGYDRHFLAINGSVAKTGVELHDLTMAVQRLADSVDANQKAAVKLAEALKAEREEKAIALKTERDQRRDGADERWSPVQKGIALLAALVSVIGLYLALTR